MRHSFGNFLLVAIAIALGFIGFAWALKAIGGCVFNVGACV